MSGQRLTSETGKLLEFASQGWMSAIEQVLQHAVEGLDTGGRTFTVSEEFTDPPAHLIPPGYNTLGWHFRITDDRVEVGMGALQEGDLVTRADYRACLPVARLIYGSDPEAIAEATRLRAAAAATGSRKGDEGALPPDLAIRLINVHNEMARRTI